MDKRHETVGMDKSKCAGCGKDLTVFAQIPIGVRDVRVCGNSGGDSYTWSYTDKKLGLILQYSGDPRKVCARRAREAACECPGCGRAHHTAPGVLCAGCKEELEFARNDKTGRTLYGLHMRLLLPNIPMVEGSAKALARVLTKAVANGHQTTEKRPITALGRISKHYTSIPADACKGMSYERARDNEPDCWVLLTTESAAALERLATIIADALAAERTLGREEGQSLLGQLVDGSLSVSQVAEKAEGWETC